MAIERELYPACSVTDYGLRLMPDHPKAGMAADWRPVWMKDINGGGLEMAMAVPGAKKKGNGLAIALQTQRT